jgi:[acyl-carrier-protein] S-malonyltransferase
MSFAMLFPGQGSQSVGMLGELANRYAVVRDTFREASEALSFDLSALISSGPAEELDRTERTQPAMLAAGVAVWRVWQERNGPTPAFLAGHSLGEYTALACAGALKFADAVKLVEKRGQLMQQAVPAGQGAMAAILGLDDEAVGAACAEAAQGEVVEAVNFNAPGQVVIAGKRAAVERAVAAASARGAKLTKLLPVSVPSHCSLMKPAALELDRYLEGIQVAIPSIPILHNVDAAAHASSAEIRKALVAQLHSPVQWVRTVQELGNRGAAFMLECGPGGVLAGLNKRINRALATQAMQDTQGIDKGLALAGVAP